MPNFSIPPILEGGEAAAHIAYRTNEAIAIYPITPSSGMAEACDAWASEGKPNLWGEVPSVTQMQSEGGAAGAVHGSLQAGALSTTFTASQGLLLMIPNMYKIAGELTPAVIHVAARALATQALSIFGDHSDVMSTRGAGWAMLFGSNVQEAQDFALIAQCATLESRVPFMHILDGFRTSHEITKIEPISDKILKAMVREDLIAAFRERALSPDRPTIRGTAHNPDTYFQARESSSVFTAAVPGIVRNVMDQFAKLTGRSYAPFEYVGAENAEHVVIAMGSGCDTIHETVDSLAGEGRKVGLVKIRLYRPFDAPAFVACLPKTVKSIAVLDRTKEPGASGEPLYQDVITALAESLIGGQSSLTSMPKVIGGRYGLGSKEFTPAMVKAVFDELLKEAPKNHFTVGIEDDVMHSSLSYDPLWRIDFPTETRAVFWGLGSDGTVGANKNTIKIIGDQTPLNVQGYFVFDSKKSGSVTISHLRFRDSRIRSAYLVDQPHFVGVHQFNLIEKFPILNDVADGATVLVNSPFSPEETWQRLPRIAQEAIVEKHLKVFALDGMAAARQTGMGKRINTIMQAAFFALSGVLPREQALEQIRKAIKKTYSKRGDAVVEQNLRAVNMALEFLAPVPLHDKVSSHIELRQPVGDEAPDFIRNVTGRLLAGQGDALTVGDVPFDGVYPTGTTQYEKRRISAEAPVWDPDLCIQCGKCVLVCPHAVVRAKLVTADDAATLPEDFKTAQAKWRGAESQRYTLQVSQEDCTGCTLCVDVCPAISKTNPERRALWMAPLGVEADHWDTFLNLPDRPLLAEPLRYNNVKNVQLLRPLFEFSGACSGCGETPYLKLLSQLFGERAIIANATGCSSIFGGNLPTTPWAKNKEGRGPAWANSLFEDNAEFGMGIRLAVDAQRKRAQSLVKKLVGFLDYDLVQVLMTSEDPDLLRVSVEQMKREIAEVDSPDATALLAIADQLVPRSVWIVGGDGWAYDIGYGGLDHVLASGQNVNILVLDTEVYSNTGGQASKSTARGAVAKFAAGGKKTAKKDLGKIAMQTRGVYVAKVAMGANDAQTLKAFIEAEQYDGPSLIIAYGPCIAHGIDMADGLRQQKLAVETGYWPLYRFEPNERKLTVDSKPPQIPVRDFLFSEGRYRQLLKSDPEAAEERVALAQEDIDDVWAWLKSASSGGPL